MKHILLVQIGDMWKQMYSGGYGTDSYNKCMNEATKLSDNSSWMIVAEKRVHIGGETAEITNKSQP